MEGEGHYLQVVLQLKLSMSILTQMHSPIEKPVKCRISKKM